MLAHMIFVAQQLSLRLLSDTIPEAHVSLFPCARGGPGTESDSSASQWDTVRRAARFTPSSFDCDVEHQLKHYTSAFELHKTYIFVVWNISTRHQIWALGQGSSSDANRGSTRVLAYDPRSSMH
eukprot:COSAG01_NODE_10422_length_2170_cov_2.690971_4_plen_124_part_00